MSSRDRILERLNALRRPDVEPVDVDLSPIQFDDLVQAFTAVSESVGGRIVNVGSTDEIGVSAPLQDLLPNDGRRVASWIDPVQGNEPVGPESDPRQFDGLDVAWMRGEIGVAENGAIWMPVWDTLPRAAMFLAEHLVVVLDCENLVHNMHDAYRELVTRRLTSGVTFGTFISGPSKTADIEQSLVIGAQGPCAHTIVLVGSSEST